MKKIKYIDLFCGIGGFHQAMNKFSGECVLASEIDRSAISTYSKNYKMEEDSILNIKDIGAEKLKEVGHFDLLCAGFPCQAFSKAGSQLGFEDETKGTLFFEIERILKEKIKLEDPVKYILLENVANIVTHDNGNTYQTIMQHLEKMGYKMNEEPIVLSPHYFGIPQLRNRAFFIGIYKGKSNMDIEMENIKKPRNLLNAMDIIDASNTEESLKISDYENEVLSAWDEFYHGIEETVLGFPVWLEFVNKKSIPVEITQDWKLSIIRKNKELYKNNKTFIDEWKKKYNPEKKFIRSHQKFEWQAGEYINSIWEGLIQFRPSGVRVKRPTEFPALVAMVQIPIIGPLKRRMSVSEVAKLQSFPESFKPDENVQQSLKQFGNSVNVKVIEFLLSELFKKGNENLK